MSATGRDASLAADARHAYLVGLGDRLRPLTDATEIQAVASRTLREHLAVCRVAYGEVEADDEHIVFARDAVAPGTPPIAGRYRMVDFGPTLLAELTRGRTIVVPTIAAAPELAPAEREAYERLGIRALVGVPLVKGGRFVANLAVHHDAPRAWTADELAAIEETAERTWAALERARAEAALRASEERHRALFAAMDEGFAVIELILDEAGRADDFRFLETNPAFERQSGLRDAVGRRVRELLPGVDGRWFARYQGVLETGVPGHFVDFAPQVARWFEVNAIPLGAPADRRVGVLFTDVTDRRQAEEVLRHAVEVATAAQRQAEAANRSKDDFLAMVSHELRTPLAPILLWARMLRARQLGPEDEARALDAIIESAEAQSRLIEDLLDLSRTTTGRLPIAPEPTEVARVVTAAVDVVRPAAVRKGLDLDVDVADDAGVVALDPRRFQQILWNLLSNAVKFTPDRGRVALRVVRDGAQLVVEVSDSGIGMSAEFLPFAFDPFRQGDTGDARAHGGLGIGLSLCRELVQLHGGTIAARSDGVGRGATFTVRLPASPSSGAVEVAPSRADAAIERALAGLRVLLVEDDAVTRDAMTAVLERAGAMVTAAALADAALRAIEGGAIDVLVSDLGLPGKDGFELIREVGARFAARGEELLPACAVSAHVLADDRRRAIEAGYAIFVAKPVDAETLVERVRDLADLLPRRGAVA